MGFGSVLRKLWSASSSDKVSASHMPSPPPRPAPTPAPRSNSRRHRHYTRAGRAAAGTTRRRSGRPPDPTASVPSSLSFVRPHQPYPGPHVPPSQSAPAPSSSPGLSSPQQYSHPSSSHPDAQSQERAVIASYRDRLHARVAQLEALWQKFDAEPDDARLTLQLRANRVNIQHALESYFAALGSRSTVDIPDVIPAIERTDLRLAGLDHQILAEVDRFEQAAADITARFVSLSSSDLSATVAADANDLLIELQLYRHGWGPVMDDRTRNRLQRAAEELRSVLDRSPTVNASPFDTSLNFEDFASAPSRLDDAPSTTGASSSQTHPPPHTPPRARVPHSEPRLTPPSHRFDDAESVGSGDNAPMQMVMSRTRTLRDMAHTAMSRLDDVPTFSHNMRLSNADDFHMPSAASNSLATAAVAGPSKSSARRAPSKVTAQSPNVRKTDAADRVSAEKDLPSWIATVDGDKQNPPVTKNMSFASTLYHTNNARVDAISDAGVMLQRSVVRGDGRCLFRAIARCRYVVKGRTIPAERTEREEADYLRARAVAELKKYRELLASFFVIEGNFTQYTKRMAQPRTYGGEPELLVLAKVLHIPIAVYVVKNGRYRQIQVYGKQYRGDPLRILYSDGVHYDALVPCE